MTGGPPAVLVVEAERPSGELEQVLGSKAATELTAELRAQAIRWARAIGAGLCRSVPERASLSEELQRVSGGRPLLVIWPSLPRLRPEHGRAALEDLESGCEVVLGPLMDGGLYLLGLSRPVAHVAEIVERASEAEPSSAIAAALSTTSGLAVGFLRPERGLRTRSDLTAAMADPMTSEGVRRTLASGRLF